MKSFTCQNCYIKSESRGNSFLAYADEKGIHNYGFICFSCKAITIGYAKLIPIGEPIYKFFIECENGRYPRLESICGVSDISSLFPDEFRISWKDKLTQKDSAKSKEYIPKGPSSLGSEIVNCSGSFCDARLRVPKGKKGTAKCPYCEATTKVNM